MSKNNDVGYYCSFGWISIRIRCCGNFRNRQKLQLLWNSSDAFHGAVVMGMALWEQLEVSSVAYLPTDGDEKNTFNNRVLYALSAIGSALFSK